ncbi:uncharacterized protein LOC119579458 [Penaeus monodon]|uniref:uncharacterized protein LOC119579458 n=1 Tax=Penaeus monodon TaxID=6687 RepID=UPI0018A6FC1D|nr:uncharacterized protein LOC119579458 [Penaeus monodon]
MSKTRFEVKSRRKFRTEPKIQWWNLKEEQLCIVFREEVMQALAEREEVGWAEISDTVREGAQNVFGVTPGRRKEDKETWWWNEEAQDSINRKKDGERKWNRWDKESHQEYKDKCSRTKMAVAKTKEKAYENLYEELGEEDILRRRKEYFEELMNVENTRERRMEDAEVGNQDVQISREEVRKTIRKMKGGNAVGLDNISIEAWRYLGEMAVTWLTNLFNMILGDGRMPEE